MCALSPSPQAGGRRGEVFLDLVNRHEHGGQRADAVRNRARVLDAATRLVARHGATNLTMDAVAAEASVGKGTVFRHFGDRTGLLLALLDRAEQQLQARFLSGPPPLGPDADPSARLRAFGVAVLRHEQEHRDLYLAAELDVQRRFLAPPYRVRHTHVAMLVRSLDPRADAELLSHALLGYLDTALTHHLLQQRELELKRLEAGWIELVTRLCP
ncbi:MAG: TetR/AcrR family transcriptional regulator [Saccharomonospora viridis]|uniref:Transcriptional regulator, TetR family n=2 Tax=Saccharomonospora viridis TaxID=1852 RepID=C7MVU5_SACVD|nr:TetR/AcrR family transcriptional regulator [Saccharomonospora viridis]ACU97045.1 transcriptional regulator, TetR family [Saccharomonospora viridis DSM 43017]KHF43272.1 TetR family transcriptional regulator [Saccharomonospora viridis]SFO81530.1 transcriptional regulator, TetR family [Saccharomonospora viridis]